MKKPYKIIKAKELYELESMEDYLQSMSCSPKITKVETISFTVRGIEVEAKNSITIGELGIYEKKIDEYMQEKELSSITKEVVEEAIEDSKKFIEHGRREKYGSVREISSDREIVFVGDKKDKILFGAFKMFQRKHSRGTRFIKELYEKEVPLEDYKGAYLYRHIAYTNNWSKARSVEPEETVEQNISYRLKDAIEDLQSRRAVSNLEIIKEVKISHQIFEALSLEEITGFLETLDHNEVKHLDMSLIKDIKG